MGDEKEVLPIGLKHLGDVTCQRFLYFFKVVSIPTARYLGAFD